MNYNFIQIVDKYFGISLATLVYFCRFLIFKKKYPNLKKIKSFQFIKLLGGGNIYIALPFFYSLKEKYPNASLEIICSNNIYNFVESSKIFDKIYVINIQNILTTFLSTIGILFQRKDDNIIINLEPYSNFANILPNVLKKTFSISANLENNFYYTQLADKIIPFKYNTPIYEIHKKIFNFIEVDKMHIGKLRNIYINKSNFTSQKIDHYSIGIIPFCSALSKERKLSLVSWVKILLNEKNKNAKFYIFGDNSEHFQALEFAEYINKETGINNFELLTKNYNFNQKINILNNLNIIYSIDTGYNHIARILNKKINSYWGASSPSLMLDDSYTTNEKIIYTNLQCSPCVHKNKKLLCNGNNICMEIDSKILNRKIKNAGWLNNEKN